MKQLMTGLLVSALLLVGGVPWASAEQISLKQSGGGVTPLGGVDDAAKVTKATTDAGEDVANDVQKVETRGAAVNILTATTTTVKSGPGHLNHLIAVGGTMGNVTIYDNTAASGTVLFGPATPTAGGVIAADIEFSVGLTVVTAAATAISGSYR